MLLLFRKRVFTVKKTTFSMPVRSNYTYIEFLSKKN